MTAELAWQTACGAIGASAVGWTLILCYFHRRSLDHARRLAELHRQHASDMAFERGKLEGWREARAFVNEQWSK